MALKQILNTIDLTEQFSWCWATSDYSESTCLSFKVSPPTLTCILHRNKSLKHHNLLIQSFKKVQNVDQLFARNYSISAAESNDYSRWPEQSQSSRRSAAKSVANHSSNLKYANSHYTIAKTRSGDTHQYNTRHFAVLHQHTTPLNELLCREALVLGSSLLHSFLRTTKTTMLGNVHVTFWTKSVIKEGRIFLIRISSSSVLCAHFYKRCLY